MGFRTSTRCANMTTNSKIFLSPQNETPQILSSLYPFPQPWALAITGLLSVSMDLTMMNISCKWDYIMCSCLYLAFSLSIMFSRFIQLKHVAALYSFLWLYGCMISHCMEVASFVYPFTSWWTLGCFGYYQYYFYKHSCINFCMIVFFHSLECIPKTWIAGLYDNSMFNFLKNWQTISHSAAAFCIPISNVWAIFL